MHQNETKQSVEKGAEMNDHELDSNSCGVESHETSVVDSIVIDKPETNEHIEPANGLAVIACALELGNYWGALLS